MCYIRIGRTFEYGECAISLVLGANSCVLSGDSILSIGPRLIVQVLKDIQEMEQATPGQIKQTTLSPYLEERQFGMKH